MESAQTIAKRILQDLQTLQEQGRLQSVEISGVRETLQSIATPPAPPPVTARRPQGSTAYPKYKAIWAYQGAEQDELTFAEGDTVEVIERQDEGWWKGCVIRPVDDSRSAVGMFPSNYVEPLPPAQSSAVVPAVPSFPPLPPRNGANGNAISEDREKQALAGYHGGTDSQQHAVPPPAQWGQSPSLQQPQQPYWQQPNGSASGYYDQAPYSNGGGPWNAGQPPMPYGSAPMGQAYGPPAAYQQQGQQYSATPPPNASEEEKRKHDKLKKLGGRLGETALGGFAGGVGFGIGSHLF